MNRIRYEGYVAVQDAMASELLEADAGAPLADLAEGLLLARGRAEAEEARDRVAPALVQLVDRGDLSRMAAHRLWARIRTCGPPMPWPPSWQGHAGRPAQVLGGR